MESDVREGFLCPICVRDLGSFHKLQNHFENSHSAEDKAVFDQVKGLFNKAKGRLLKQGGNTDDPSTSHTSDVETQVVNTYVIWDAQEQGASRHHFENFKKMRDSRIDRLVIESNKVLIRLDKLHYFLKFFKARSKEFEQGLVPWVKDADVPYCPTCGDRFNLARRRHHCRLCGAIMCTRCSMFVSFDLADKLVQTLKKLPANRRRTQSVVDLSRPSLLDQELSIRSCRDCYILLLKRKDRMDSQANQPLLVLLYEKLRSAMETATKHSPEYKRMADSLHRGEEDCDLNKANEMRFKLMKLYETIDVISKKIDALDTNDTENPPSFGALRLQHSIRLASHAYLQENMLTLQSLPSLPKLEQLQKERRKAQERKLRQQMLEAEREREEAMRIRELERLQREREASRKMDSQWQDKATMLSSDKQNIVLREGWSSEVRSMDESRHRDIVEQDPILEQIAYVKEMISQAESVGRVEEVKSLSLNLQELSKEYHRQRSSPPIPSSRSAPSSNVPAKNPFLDEDEILSASKNPFLSDESNHNPFSQRDIKPRHSSDPDSDPMLQQICYISQCLDEATRLGKRDEMIILQDNLRDLQAVYNGRYT